MLRGLGAAFRRCFGNAAWFRSKALFWEAAEMWNRGGFSLAVQEVVQ